MGRPVLIAAIVIAGCSSGFHRKDLHRTLRAQAPAFDDAQLAAIERLRPQARLPMRIVVSQPISGPAWSAAEVDAIAAWEQPLRRVGVARQVTVLPESLIDRAESRCGLEAQRTAAARLGADTLLVLNPATEVDAYVNVLAPLDATIIGLWVVPAHHRDALTLLEGTLIDNRNHSVYAFMRGTGSATSMRPYLLADQSDVSSRSRLQAVKIFGERFLQQVSALR